MALYILHLTMTQAKSTTHIPFSSFVSDVRAGKIASVTIRKGEFVEGTYKDGKKFRTNAPDDEGYLVSLLSEHGVRFDIKPTASKELWATLLLSILMFGAVIGFFWLIMMRQTHVGSNQAFSFSQARVKRFLEGKPSVTFNDVAGVEEAKQELREVVDFLKDPERFRRLGARIPKGVLLLGPPGCGKTLLARAVAGEAGVPFFFISGSEFVEMFVGVGAARVRSLFEQAKQHKPCIIFIDELDAVGRQRGAGLGGGHDEREQTLNELLVQMDGFDPNEGIIIIAATNRPDILDPALLRPGRFDRRIVVDPPDLKGRHEILKIHTRNKPLADDVDLELLAKRTPGFTGADLANLVNEAAILAARKKKDKISMEDFEEALDKVLAGPERRSRVISEREKRFVAYHEAGHALAAKLLPHADKVHKVTIMPRGMSLGQTMQLPTEDRYIMTKSELLDRITVLLAGRAAEEMALGEVTTGAQNDLEEATELARKMVCDFGMSEEIGPVQLGKKRGPVFLGRDLVEERDYSEEVANAIDREVRKIIGYCYERARRLLSENRETLERIVSELLERETLDSEELDRIFEEAGIVRPSEKDEGSEGRDAA